MFSIYSSSIENTSNNISINGMSMNNNILQYTSTTSSSSSRAAPAPVMIDRGRWRPGIEMAPNCPRCDSSNTKFCYYNNYSLTQPRYFCKGCRRYWTKGGSLRNVPVGGGCRKNRRGKAFDRSSIISSSAGNSYPSYSGSSRQPSSSGASSALRPDLALDDMVGSSSGSSLDVSSSDGSSIDLAHLYTKFLSNCPSQQQQQPEPASTTAITAGRSSVLVNQSRTMIDVSDPFGSPDSLSYHISTQLLEQQERLMEDVVVPDTAANWNTTDHHQQHGCLASESIDNYFALDQGNGLVFEGINFSPEVISSSDHIFSTATATCSSMPASSSSSATLQFGNETLIHQSDNSLQFGEHWSTFLDRSSTFEAFYT